MGSALLYLKLLFLDHIIKAVSDRKPSSILRPSIQHKTYPNCVDVYIEEHLSPRRY